MSGKNQEKDNTAAADKSKAEETAADKSKAEETAAEEQPENLTKIIIASAPGDTGDVFVSHNGRQFLIQRDQPVEVPDCVINCLDDAVIDTVAPKKVGEKTLLVPVQIPRFNYRRVK